MRQNDTSASGGKDPRWVKTHRLALLPDALLAGAQGSEIIHCARRKIAKKAHDDAPCSLSPDGDIEEHPVRGRRVRRHVLGVRAVSVGGGSCQE
jgi:hypothetical protein